MKKFIKIVVTITVLFFSIASAQTTTLSDATIKVYGNCETCQRRIEKAAKKVKGVESAQWDSKSKMLMLKYDSTQTSEKEVEEKIALAGHDTKNQKASDKAYNDLPGCCQYERKKQ